MDYSTEWNSDAVVALHRDVFTASEGAEEGEVIAGLARNLLSAPLEDDVVSISCADNGALVGNIIFSRLFFERDIRTVFLLGPVAVATGRQRQGVGQALLRWGLLEMKRRGADVAVTYGDPKYYTKVGFRPVGTDIVPAPQPLQWPEGWMAQPLTEAQLRPFKGPVRCVAPFDRPEYW